MNVSLPPPFVLEEGVVLAGKYRLDRVAGFGGMAALWVATNQSTGAEVCIKILGEGADDETSERFRREAYAAARLTHRAIVRTFDLVELGARGDIAKGERPKALAIVMELLRGETLGDLLMKRGALPVEEALDIAVPVVSALAHAHRAGVVHRDLKPDNVFLARDPDGKMIPKVLDFGVSKVTDGTPLTQDGVIVGTPSFMSPEQARGARGVDARTDVFTAGILLYMMVSGKNPFEADSFTASVKAVLERQPPRLETMSEALWEVLARALAKRPEERFRDATELGIALRYATGRTTLAESGTYAAARSTMDSEISVPPVTRTSGAEIDPAATPSPTTQELARSVIHKRSRAVPIGAALAGLVVVVAAVVGLRSSPPAPAAAKQADDPRAERAAAEARLAEATAAAAAAAVAVQQAEAARDAGAPSASAQAVAPAPAPARPVVPPTGAKTTKKAPAAIAVDPGF